MTTSEHDPSPFAGTTPVASLARGDGGVTLVEGQSFCISGRDGDISDDLPHGLFVLDSRILSRWLLRLDGHPLEPLTAEVTDPFHATFVGRGHPVEGHADADVVVFRDRDVGWGMREEIEVTNHGLVATEIELVLHVDVDFAELFAVKESRVRRRGEHGTELLGGAIRFVHRYDGRSSAVDVSAPGAVAAPGRLEFQLSLAPGASWRTCVQVALTIDGEALEPRFRCGIERHDTEPAQRLATWRARLPLVVTSHTDLSEAVHRAGEDLGALRIFDPEHPEVPVVAAGAPWFMTVFGRDSLLTAWMTLLADPRLAEGVLTTLARFQGEDEVATTEEQPGKILHEMRFGSAAGASLRGGDVYFGSVDATPLFVMLLGELRRWDLADDVVARLLPHADRALDWIAGWGDRDGDGYVEYRRLSPDGLANQGWKDSWDAVRHLDGTLADGPIALCEAQAYVYAAYVARAHFAREAGDAPTFARYRTMAADLRRRFNEDFWLEEEGWFALGLDGDKRPIGALTSNVGHCLWTGIVAPEKAAAVAARLVGDGMWSGWGIRTLSSSMRAFNPVSYHNGSVWPHDNALCAAGLARYGFVEEAHRVIAGQVDAAAAFGGRLPELFAGFDRSRPGRPASYPTSCSPQAWAAASPLLWLRTLLRLDPWAPHGQVFIQPELPEWLPDLRVEGIVVAGRTLDVAVAGGEVSVDVHGPVGLEVVRSARPPLSALSGRDGREDPE